MHGPPRILLLDANPATRARTRALLAEDFPAVPVFDAATADEALALAMPGGPWLVLIEARLHGGSGLAAIPALGAALGPARIVVLTALPEDQYGPSARRLGASGFIAKQRAHEDLPGVVGAWLAAAGAVAATALSAWHASC